MIDNEDERARLWHEMRAARLDVPEEEPQRNADDGVGEPLRERALPP